MHNLFKNSKKANYPYDYLICDNFLKKYQEYDSSYPLDYLSNSIRMSRDLTYGDPTYENVYSTKFLDLHNYVYSKQFITDFLNIFNNEIEKRFIRDEFVVDPRSISIVEKPYELRNFITRSHLKNDQQLFLFPRMDFGVGYSGYGIQNGGRGVHTDNITRLVSILLFFTDQGEIDGGEHQLHTINENYDPKITNKINVKKNRLVASLQSNDAFHSVNPLLAGERRAIYMSVSCSKQIWKDYNDEKLKFISQNRR
jgi:hypothetical protein